MRRAGRYSVRRGRSRKKFEGCPESTFCKMKGIPQKMYSTKEGLVIKGGGGPPSVRGVAERQKVNYYCSRWARRDRVLTSNYTMI